MSKEQGPGNFRVEEGQPISQAFSAAGWNRAQAAADLVLGSNGGIKGRDHRPPALRQVVTCLKGNANELMFPGHAVQIAANYQNANTPVLEHGDLPATAAGLNAATRNNATLKQHIAQAASERNNPSPFPVILYQTSGNTIPDVSPPIGFVTELSEYGDETVRVCISGTALALVRIFETQTQDVGGNKSVLFTSLVRSRRVYADGSGGSYYDQAPNGVMDVGPGGSVLLLSQYISAPQNFPCYAWVWVIL